MVDVDTKKKKKKKKNTHPLRSKHSSIYNNFYNVFAIKPASKLLFPDLLTSNHDEDRSGIVTSFSETDDKQSETSN